MKNTLPKRFELLPPEQYLPVGLQLVHFSAKLTNSKVRACGVRLAPDANRTSYPYVYVRNLINQGVDLDLDYLAKSDKAAAIVKHLHAAKHDPAPVMTDDERRHLLEIMDSIKQTKAEIHTSTVSLRTKQILIPKGQGYVALSPLGSNGLGRLLNTRVTQHNQMVKKGDKSSDKPTKLRYLQTAVFGIGGSHPINVGSLAQDLRRPLVFHGPREQPDVKRAIALYYQGSRIVLPRPLLMQYLTWLNQEGRGHTDMRTRLQELAYIHALVRAVLWRAEQDLRCLQEHDSSLPKHTNGPVAETAPRLARGLTLPACRTAEWKYEFAWTVANQIAETNFGKGQPGFNFDGAARQTLCTMIRGML
ncbi:hypothetical protein HNQ59_001741 [Chitinivorax tropicus]|uniref:Uncharacterized protein n=1 Tax=Chitinivorax tropicus TaxID=714531 RepID=A0A840MNX4_9PROT|nr:type I-F CRISPR-associated protein Csy1 [Chitinivorax tropicus]MBB5018452.1 hypothetical protein [Chitinivorax tropicus]